MSFLRRLVHDVTHPVEQLVKSSVKVGKKVLPDLARIGLAVSTGGAVGGASLVPGEVGGESQFDITKFLTGIGTQLVSNRKQSGSSSSSGTTVIVQAPEPAPETDSAYIQLEQAGASALGHAKKLYRSAKQSTQFFLRGGYTGAALRKQGAVFSSGPAAVVGPGATSAALRAIRMVVGTGSTAARVGRGATALGAIGSGGGLVGQYFRSKNAEQRIELARQKAEFSFQLAAQRNENARQSIARATEALNQRTALFAINQPAVIAKARYEEARYNQLLKNLSRGGPADPNKALKDQQAAIAIRLSIAQSERALKDLAEAPTAAQVRAAADAKQAAQDLKQAQEKHDQYLREQRAAQLAVKQKRADSFGALLAQVLTRTPHQRGGTTHVVTAGAGGAPRSVSLRFGSAPKKKRKRKKRAAARRRKRRKSKTRSK